jgi:hypothetical protein
MGRSATLEEGDRLTVRGISPETIGVLQEEADQRGLSLNRLVIFLLDERAELRRRRMLLARTQARLEAVRRGLAQRATGQGIEVSDSGALLWAERGGRGA